MRPLIQCAFSAALRVVAATGLVLLAMTGICAEAQAPKSPKGIASLPPVEDSPIYCAAVSRGVEHGEALKKFCEWALSLNERLPNILSEQKTSRFVEVRDKQYRARDSVTANVSYENGEVRYSDVRVNGRAIKGSIEHTGGTWSTGEYGTDIEALFVLEQKFEMSFLKIDNDQYKGALVFQQTITPDDNRSWELRYGKDLSEKTLFPGFTTRIWLDPTNARLLHMEKETAEMDKKFPIRFVEKLTTYADTPLGDGTSFILPIECVTINCEAEGKKHCTLNDLTFSHWRKFGAAHRIVTEPTGQQ